jgi:hypothetical protein
VARLIKEQAATPFGCDDFEPLEKNAPVNITGAGL